MTPHPVPRPFVRIAPDRVPAPALVGCAVLAVLGLITGLVLARPDLTSFGAAFGSVAFVAVLLAEAPIIEALVEVDAERMLEGDMVAMRVVLRAVTTADRLDLLLVLPAGLSLIEGSSPTALRLQAGDERSLDFAVRADRWGVQPIGSLLIRVRDRSGLVAWEAGASDPHVVRVLPGAAVLAHLLRPNRTRVHAGNQVARVRGPGTEFAEIRPYQPGDTVRSVNWRLTARRGQPWVNDHHPERNTDIVMFLDTFGADALPDGVRAAAAIAVAHLDQQDRVGLIGFGGSLRWLEPAGGRTQEYRLVDTLITSQVFDSEAWRSLAVVPRRCLPPNALVIAVSTLEDRRTVAALGDLRARGVDLAIVQVFPRRSSPISPGPAGSTPLPTPNPTPLAALAQRVLELEHSAVRSRFARIGVPIARWDPEEPLARPIEEVIAFRRRLRSRSA